MWFKKKANIIGYNPNTAEDGTDWRTTGNNGMWIASYILPDAADAGNYFYLPALGYYLSGQQNNVGNVVYYWSSSAFTWDNNSAYDLYFVSNHVFVGSSDHFRTYGFRVDGFE